MQNIQEAAAAFLACKRVAATSLPRAAHEAPLAASRMTARMGCPAARRVRASAPPTLPVMPVITIGGVQAVVIGTRPEIAEDTMRECAELGIKQVWMHRGPGAGSVSAAATGYGRQHGITVIDGGCPLMFGPTADLGHKIMRLVYAGHVPKQA